MAQALGGTAIEAFWTGTSFLLTSTVFQPVFGSFSDIFGRKSMIYVSLVLFAVGAIVAAVAKDFGVILVGRSIQGIGGGGIIVLTEIVVTDLVPMRQRGNYFSIISSMWALGTVIGPLLGGGFSQNVDWTWIFWINLPFVGIGGAMIIAFLTLNIKMTSLAAKLRRVDWVGIVLFVGSVTGILIPVSWGGIMYAWDSWRTLVPLLISAAGLIVFVVYEEWVAPEPLIRTSVFKNRTAAGAYLQAFLHGIILWGLLYFLPLYYETAKGFGPILTGVAMFPQTFTVAPASIVVGALVAKTGKFRWANWLGWSLTTLGLGILIYLKVDTNTPSWIFMNIVSGLGMGILFPPMAIGVQAAASDADQAYAVTMFAFLRLFGQTIGVAIGGVIFQNQMQKKLLSYPLLAGNANEYSRDASGLVQIIKGMPAGEMKDQLLLSYVDALRYVWIVLTVLAFCALASNMLLKNLSLDREHVTEQGFVDGKKADEEKGGD